MKITKIKDKKGKVIGEKGELDNYPYVSDKEQEQLKLIREKAMKQYFRNKAKLSKLGKQREKLNKEIEGLELGIDRFEESAK